MKNIADILDLFVDLPFAVDGIARFRNDVLSVYDGNGEYRAINLETTPAYIRQGGIERFELHSSDGCADINKVTTQLVLVCSNTKYTVESLKEVLVYILTVNDYSNTDRIQITSIETDKDTILKDEKLKENIGDYIKITFNYWFLQANSCTQPTLECIC